MRGGRFHLALEPESLADHVSQPRKNLAQVAAGLLLKQYRGSEETCVQQGNPDGEIPQCNIQRRTQVLFVEEGAEFLAKRIGELFAEHLQADGKRVSGAHGAGQKVERFGKLLFQRGQALGALLPHDYIGQRAEHQRHRNRGGGALSRNGTMVPKPKPGIMASPMAAISRLADQLRPAC